LVKNTQVIIHALHQCFIKVRLLDHNYNTLGQIHCIPHILFSFNPPYSSWTIMHHQFPLQLAYAATFNSCLGLTLDRAVLDLRTPVFAHGQLYTALSQVRHSEHCKILLAPDNIEKITSNVVYEKLLLL
jgi:hypothetical protein